MNSTAEYNATRAGRSVSVGAAAFGASYYQPNNGEVGVGDYCMNQTPGARVNTVVENVPGLLATNGHSDESTHAHNDALSQQDLLQRHGCERDDLSVFDSEAQLVSSKETGSKVLVKRVFRSSLLAASEADRVINVLSTATDPSMPLLIESLELKDVIWTVIEYKSVQTVAELVAAHGPLPDDALKTALNQLFSGIASLFLAGFSHLRICDQTICFDSARQLTITSFQYACEYGKEKVGDLYATTQEKYGDDIYVAPEVFANHTYNARKAVIWSCGVLLYFMVTGQTDKLSNLEHPSFEKMSQTPVPASTPTSPSKTRKMSVSSVQAKIIHYPNRFDVPNYVRWIIPKMLEHDPVRRAELIEIASRVPKDFAVRDARPLIEMAWLDYKDHVGPYAGLKIQDPTASSSSSIYSMASAMTNPLRSLLGKGHSRRQSVPVVRGSGW